MVLLSGTVSKLRKFLRLPSVERRLLIKAGFLLMGMRLALWLLAFPSLIRLVERLNHSRSEVLATDPLLVEKIAWAVQTSARYIPKATCLTQALAAQILLRRRGFQADLHIGVARDSSKQFQAHAWIVSDGKVIIGGAEHENYVPFDSLAMSEARSKAHTW
jgi:hypothetical protein